MGRRIKYFALNSNIRCIEIGWHQASSKQNDGWIVTLDVLKWKRGSVNVFRWNVE